MNEPPPLPESRRCSRCGATIQSAANFCHASGAAVPKSIPTPQGQTNNNPPKSRRKKKAMLELLLLFIALLVIAIGYIVYAVNTGKRPSAQQKSDDERGFDE